jgi:hypothetical protein
MVLNRQLLYELEYTLRGAGSVATYPWMTPWST